MVSLGYATIVFSLVMTGMVGAVAGYAFANSRQRRAAGGKSVDELKTELDEYRSNVTEHFQTTAGLLKNMTEQYRSVYQHMADGAEQLCDTSNSTAQIESLRTGLLPTPDARPTSDSEHPADFDQRIDNNDISSGTVGQVSESADSPEGLEPASESVDEASSMPSQEAVEHAELSTREDPPDGLQETSPAGEETKLR